MMTTMPKAKEAPVEPEEASVTAPPLTAADVLKSFDRLSPEERAKLAAIGTVIPQGADETTLTASPTWGYRCIHCNGISVYFPGTKWPDGNGVDQPRPMGGMPISSIPIMQMQMAGREIAEILPPSKINRSNPQCPNCGGGVPLNSSGGLLEEHIREVAQHIKVLDEHFTHYAALEIARKRRTMPTVDLQGAVNHDRINAAGTKASALMPAQDRADVEFAASQPGFMEAVAKEMGKK
jgi:hypothetical protein